MILFVDKICEENKIFFNMYKEYHYRERERERDIPLHVQAWWIPERIIIFSSRNGDFYMGIKSDTSDDVVFPSWTLFYTISPYDISFLIVDSMSNRVNRLFFLTAFRSVVTFNFLHAVVIAVFKRWVCTCTTATCMEKFARVCGHDIDIRSLGEKKIISAGQKYNPQISI